MMSHKRLGVVIARAVRMDRAELLWRGRAALRIAAARAAVAVRRPRWQRSHVIRAIAESGEFHDVRRLAERGDWHRLHREISSYLTAAPPRFVIGPALRGATAARIAARFPDAPAAAAARADRILAGEYDLLGYRGLRFPAASGVDWHYDPVHDRRAPAAFWSTIAYLDPSCGDHKVIWELNRHQHWMALGRAYWLTGNFRYRARVLMELASWLDANPPLIGINWSSMLELALRSISWVWALNMFADHASDDQEP